MLCSMTYTKSHGQLYFETLLQNRGEKKKNIWFYQLTRFYKTNLTLTTIKE